MVILGTQNFGHTGLSLGINELKKIKSTNMDKTLKLSEKLFCLAVNPKNGGILLNASSTLAIGISGSVFVELQKKEMVSILKGIVKVLNVTVQTDEVYDFFLNRIRSRTKPRKLRNWISYFNVRGRTIQKMMIRSLVNKNVLRTEEKRFLFFPYQKVYLMDRELVESIRKEVEATLLNFSGAGDDAVILAVMVAKSNLLSRIFPDRERRKIASRNLKNLPETEVSKAVMEAVQMMHAAVYAAIS